MVLQGGGYQSDINESGYNRGSSLYVNRRFPVVISEALRRNADGVV